MTSGSRNALASLRQEFSLSIQSALTQPTSRSVRDLREITLVVSDRMKQSSDMQRLWSALQCPAMNPVQTLGEIHGTESKTIIAPTPSDRWRRARAAQNKVTRPHPEEAFDESPKVSQSAVTSSAPWGLAHPTGGRNVTHLAALGLGSLGALRRPASDVVGRSSRAPYRLFQLALALAIADKLRMSGSENLHLTFSDPAFEDLDLDLINSFEGIKVLPLDGDSSIFMPDLGGQKLLYMPCCPRDLYGEAITTFQSRGRLGDIAIYGTSLRSLAESGWLLRATERQSGAFSLTSAPLPASGLLEAESPLETAGAAAAQSASDLLARLFQDETLLEITCPDFAAVDVATGLHVFRLAS